MVQNGFVRIRRNHEKNMHMLNVEARVVKSTCGGRDAYLQTEVERIGCESRAFDASISASSVCKSGWCHPKNSGYENHLPTGQGMGGSAWDDAKFIPTRGTPFGTFPDPRVKKGKEVQSASPFGT